MLLSGCQLTPDPQQTTAEIHQPATAASQAQPADSDLPPATDLQSATNETKTPPAALAPADYRDLWQRIASQLTLPIADNRQIDALRNWYLSHPAYMSQITERAEPFLYLIVEEVERRELPLELALLPIVESAFDPFAYSSGGAAGLWQFMPATGERFHLQQDWWYEGRRDVRASTHAALDYLEYLNQLFNGDWLHTLAAYNSGEGRVLGAIKRNRRHGKPTDFWNLSLPRETRSYVPKLLALSDILQHPDRYGLSFPALPNHPTVAEVAIDGQIDLSLAARLAGMELDSLRRLNPAFKRWATAPDGPHRLLLPAKRVQQFELALADTPASKRMKWDRYVVRSGDTLSTIAAQYDTRTDVLKKANKLSSNLIRVNQPLLIPVATNSLDDSGQLPGQSSALTASRNGKIEYRVKAGDTLWDISQAYGISYKDLARWNHISTDGPLRPGQMLTIYPAGERDESRTVTYEVRSGDSLSAIAAKFNVKVGDLIRWNQLDRDSYLQPGQTLKVIVAVNEA